MTDLIKTLMGMSGDENVVVVRRPFVKFAGSLEGGMLLNQLLYWTPRTKDGWIAKTDQDFSDETCLSTYGVRKARADLEKKGILETKVKKFNGAPTVHYRLDLTALGNQWRAFISQMDFTKTENPNSQKTGTITENTTENNQQATPVDADASPPEIPVNLDQWLEELQETPNRQAVLVKMCENLYPDRAPPGFAYVAKIARQVGGASVLADYLWRFSPPRQRPYGDVLAYILKVHKNGPGNARPNGRTNEGQREGLSPEKATAFRDAMRKRYGGKDA